MKMFKRIDKLIEKKIGWISGTNKMLIIITIYILIGLLGACTKDVITERNNPIYINNTINNTITINSTMPCEELSVCESCNECEYNRNYVLSLIRQLKHYEKQQDKYFNDSDCNDDLNHTNIELDRCKQELCISWNSSWC